MSKKVSKSEIVKLVNQADILEAITQTIDRTDQASKKQTDLNRIVQEIQIQIKDERDILIIAIKVR